MHVNHSTLTHLDIVNSMANLSDDATISAELAAIFLGISVKTLARLRQNGDGPVHIQYPASGSTARNQKVNYKMRDLREYQYRHVVKSTMDAAVMRGLAFRRVNDLVIPQPFWRIGSEIINHALCVSLEDFSTYLNKPEADIIWVKWSKALSEQWKNKALREPYHSSYVNLLSGLIKSADQIV
jgi:hypothetical protein